MYILSLLYKVFILLALGAAAVIDVRKSKLPLLFILLVAAGTIGFQIALREHSIIDLLEGMAVGALLLAFSLLSKGSVGIADALTFIITGIFLGFWSNISLLILSLTLCAVFGIGLSIIKKKSMKTSLPFMPFILLGYTILLLFI